MDELDDWEDYRQAKLSSKDRGIASLSMSFRGNSSTSFETPALDGESNAPDHENTTYLGRDELTGFVHEEPQSSQSSFNFL